MDLIKYSILIDEVYYLLDSDRLRATLKCRIPRQRCDGIQDLIRDGILKSSISMYDGEPHFFGGRVYERMTWNDFGDLIYDLMKRCKVPMGDYYKVKSISNVCRSAVSRKELVLDDKIVFNNCVLEPNHRTTFRFGKEFRQVEQLDYRYAPRDFIYLWRDFLDEVIPDKKSQNYLQEFLGATLTNKNPKILLVITGEAGRVITDVVEHVLKGVTRYSIDFLLKNNYRGLGEVIGKKLNCSEMGEGDFTRLAEPLSHVVKCDPVEVRRNIVRSMPQLLVNADFIPRVDTWGMQIRDSVNLLETKDLAHSRCVLLMKELKGEYPAIMNWVLDGRDRYLRCGLSLIKNVSDIEDLRFKRDTTVTRFMEERGYYKIDESGEDPQWTELSYLYRRYRDVFPDGIEESMFSKVLKRLGYSSRIKWNVEEFGIYGIAILKERSIKGNNQPELNKRISYPVPDETGKLWARTLNGLARCTGWKYGDVCKLYTDGKLEGTYRTEGAVMMFDLEQVQEILKGIVEERKNKYRRKCRQGISEET